MELSLISYLLVFVQLTRRVDNGLFSPVFDNFFMIFINVGPAYIRGWGGRVCRGRVGGGKNLNTEAR